MSDRPRAPADRPLGVVSLLALGVNGIVGVGIFFLPADVAKLAPGPWTVAVFAGTALALLPVALTFSTLAGRFDEDGGPVLYARAAFGPLASFAVGWIAYVSAITSTAAVCVSLVDAAAPAIGLGGYDARALATALVTALALVCAGGLSLSARVWTGLTVLKLLPLLSLIVVGLLLTRPSLAPAEPVTPVAPVPLSALLAAGLTVTFAYQGFEIVPIVAGQARSSKRLVPFAVVGSLAIGGVLYVLLSFLCVRALPSLATSAAPLADTAAVVGGPSLSALVRAGTNVSSLGISVGMVAMTPRYLSALAERGGLGFGLDRLDHRGVPQRALAVTWLLVVALILAVGRRADLFALSSLAVLSQYTVTALALITLSARRERGLSLGRAWPAWPALAVGLAFVSSATAQEYKVGGAALGVGAALWLASARHAARGSAL